jgi:hypothetical protein
MSDSSANSYLSEVDDRLIGSTVMGGLIGNFIEWYDWTIYGLLSSVFAAQFFPSGNAITSLLATLATFALGFVMRPIGSIVLSPMADKYGRRRMGEFKWSSQHDALLAYRFDTPVTDPQGRGFR